MFREYSQRILSPTLCEFAIFSLLSTRIATKQSLGCIFTETTKRKLDIASFQLQYYFSENNDFWQCIFFSNEQKLAVIIASVLVLKIFQCSPSFIGTIRAHSFLYFIDWLFITLILVIIAEKLIIQNWLTCPVGWGCRILWILLCWGPEW